MASRAPILKENALTNTEAEEAFVKAFILPAKQERHLKMLASARDRKKILDTLYHTLAFVPALATRIPSRDHSPEAVLRLLGQKGAGATCYLISPFSDLDRKEMPLQEAVTQLISLDSTGIACSLPGRLAYYKAELEGYLLEKPLRPASPQR